MGFASLVRTLPSRDLTTSDISPDARTPRAATVVVVLALAAFSVIAWVTRTAGVTHSNDDALYALLGDQLTHLSYRETFKVGAPMHGQYPPLWPAMLGVVQLLSGGSETAAFLLVTATMTAGLFVFYHICRRLLPPWIAAAVLVVAALNPFTITSAGRLMSESAFVLWTMVTLWALLRAREGLAVNRWLLLAAVASLAATLTRSIGVTLIAGVLASWVVERRWRAFAIFSLFCLTVMGGWLGWTLTHNEGISGRSYIEDAAQVTKDKSVMQGTTRLSVGIARKVVQRVRLQLLDIIPSGMPYPTVPGTRLDNFLWLATTLTLGALGAAALARRLPAAVLYLLFYLGLLAVWPWAPRRFFVPLQPLVLLGFVAGAMTVGRWRPEWRRVGQPIAVVFLALVSIGGIPQTAELVRTGLRCDRQNPWTSDGCYNVDQQAFFKVVVFARDSPPANARFLVEREAAFAYHTGRVVQHAQMPLGKPDEEFRHYLRDVGIEYIVLTRLTSKEVRDLLPKLASNCRYLSIVRVFPPTGRLYRLLPEPAPEHENACADVSRGIGPSPT